MAMRYRGTLQQWNDERGFGWVQTEDGRQRLFMHVSALMPRPSAARRPQVGQAVEFSIGVERGKPCALQVFWGQTAADSAAARAQRQGGNDRNGRNSGTGGTAATVGASAREPGRQRTPRATGASTGAAARLAAWSYGVLLAWLLVLLLLSVVWRLPGWVWLAYAGMSALTFIAYGQDKRAAQTGGWRTSEAQLQTLAVAGGWPGALLAQQWLRHKSSKASFQQVFWCVVVLNMAVVIVLNSPWGRQYYQ